MLEDGYSINYIHTKYGIGHSQLEKLWMLYQEYGVSVLQRQKYTRSDVAFKHEVVWILKTMAYLWCKLR